MNFGLKLALVVCIGSFGFGLFSLGHGDGAPETPEAIPARETAVEASEPAGTSAKPEPVAEPAPEPEAETNASPAQPLLVPEAPARQEPPVEPAPEPVAPLRSEANLNPAPETAAALPQPAPPLEDPAPALDEQGNPVQERGPLTLDHELPAAIQFLARMADVNIHFDPSINFTNGAPVVSLRWEDVTARDALEEVLDVHGLMLQENPNTGIARVVRKPAVDPLVTAILQLKYSNPSNIIDLITSTFADPSRSRVRADPRTSQLVVVSTERELEGITNLLAHLDSPTRQVLIEARLLETAKNPRSIKGIDWSGTLENQNVTFGNGFTRGTTTTQLPGTAGTAVLPSGRTVGVNGRSSSRTELLTELGAGGLSLDTARGFYPSTAFLNADGVRAVLSFLNSDADTEVVATPRQVTADNQTATLSVTRAFPIFEITPGSAQTPPTAKITYTNLGTILRVTPRIAGESNIVLKVVPEVSNIDSKDRQIINGDVNEANVYAIRKMETEVLIPSGHTLVMGGLISDTISKSYTKVPLLGDLPGIGLMFRRDSKARNKSNLLIFVTPTIVRTQDFQPASSHFLQTRAENHLSAPEENAWNRGRPYDWRKGE